MDSRQSSYNELPQKEGGRLWVKFHYDHRENRQKKFNYLYRGKHIECLKANPIKQKLIPNLFSSILNTIGHKLKPIAKHHTLNTKQRHRNEDH